MRLPNLQVDMKEVLDLALQNNPDILSQQINVLMLKVMRLRQKLLKDSMRACRHLWVTLSRQKLSTLHITT